MKAGEGYKVWRYPQEWFDEPKIKGRMRIALKMARIIGLGCRAQAQIWAVEKKL